MLWPELPLEEKIRWANHCRAGLRGWNGPCFPLACVCKCEQCIKSKKESMIATMTRDEEQLSAMEKIQQDKKERKEKEEVTENKPVQLAIMTDIPKGDQAWIKCSMHQDETVGKPLLILLGTDHEKFAFCHDCETVMLETLLERRLRARAGKDLNAPSTPVKKPVLVTTAVS